MTEIKTKWWTFSQNNSGGVFDFNEDTGITHFVVIEGVDEAHAISRAESIGIYFDGCSTGQDCDCCGDRWHTPYDSGDDVPKVYDQDIRSDGKIILTFGGWMEDGKEVSVLPISGPVEWYGASKE